jgi:hypothetical protein
VLLRGIVDRVAQEAIRLGVVAALPRGYALR